MHKRIWKLKKFCLPMDRYKWSLCLLMAGILDVREWEVYLPVFLDTMQRC